MRSACNTAAQKSTSTQAHSLVVVFDSLLQHLLPEDVSVAGPAEHGLQGSTVQVLHSELMQLYSAH